MTSPLLVVHRGAADQHEPALIEPQARNTIRYADAAAWTTAAAVARALGADAESASVDRSHVGIITISTGGPVDTMAQVHANADAGFSSPLRYGAASPGSLAGVPCIAFGLKGPSLNLAMAPADGLHVATRMASAWLTRGHVDAIVVVTYVRGRSGGAARALLLSCGEPGDGRTPFTDDDSRWLCEAPA